MNPQLAPVRILFDAKSSQVEVQLESQEPHATQPARLTELFSAITALGWSYGISSTSGAPLDAGQLAGYNVLCILTRLNQTAPGTRNPFPPGTQFAFQPDEISAIQDFVKAGGGLLLISNHGPFPNNVKDDQTINDRVLAAAFDIEMAPACFQPKSGPFTFSDSCMNPSPAMQDSLLAGVRAVEVHNCCAISPGAKGIPVITLPTDGVVNISPTNHDGPKGKVYAVALDWGRGRVVIGGNSGLAGNAASNYPAPGLIDAVDNKKFLLNSLAYLGGQMLPKGQP